MRARYAKIFWNKDDVIVQHRSRPSPPKDLFPGSGGACFATWCDAHGADLLALILVHVRMISEAGVPFHAIHKAFTEIDEYAACCAP